MKYVALVLLVLAVIVLVVLAAFFISQRTDRAAADDEWFRGLEDDYYD